MDSNRVMSLERTENSAGANDILTESQLDMLPSSRNPTESEQALPSNDVPKDLLKMFESQLQQTVNLVDLMPADQKSRALASMYGLLSQKLPESSCTVTDQESGEHSGKQIGTILTASGDEILNTLPASLLQSDSEDNAQTAGKETAGLNDFENINQVQGCLLESKTVENSTGSSIILTQSPNDDKELLKKRVPEKLAAILSSNNKELMKKEKCEKYILDGDSGKLLQNNSILPPKKRNRSPKNEVIPSNRNDLSSFLHGTNILQNGNFVSSAVSSTSRNVGSKYPSQESENQPILRRSRRERKISMRVAEYLGPGTSLLKSGSQSCQMPNFTSKPEIKRRRGRPKKVSDGSPVICRKSSDNEEKNPAKNRIEAPQQDSAVPVAATAECDPNSQCSKINQETGKSVGETSRMATDQLYNETNIDDPPAPKDDGLPSINRSDSPTERNNFVGQSLNVDGDALITKENRFKQDDSNSDEGSINNIIDDQHSKYQGLQSDCVKLEDNINSNSSVDNIKHAKDEAEHKEGTRKNESICMENFNQYIVKENNRYRCTICGKLANYKANLKVHLRVHSGEKPFKCSICDKSFAASNNLQRHINETHEKKRPFICETCGQGCFTLKSLSAHQQKMHSNEEPKEKPRFTCQTCGKSFKWKSDLKDHSIKHTSAMPFRCETCGQAFTFLNNLRRHRKIHRDFRPHKCCQCDKRFIEPRCLRLHIKRAHLGQDVKPQGEPKHKCQVCSKPFYMKSWLELHMLSHTGHKPHACSICDRRFSLKANLKRHMLTHTGENPFPCTECPKKFKSRRALKLHLMIHRNEKPFVCDVCNKGFTNKSTLKEHQSIHDSHPRFFCDICNQTFLRTSHLQLHKERHEGKPRYTCDKCSGKFYRKCDLNRHQLKHSSIKPYGCLSCNKRFTRKQYLNNHIKFNHPNVNRDSQMKKVLLQEVSSPDLSRSIFRIISKQPSSREAGTNDSLDVSTLIKLADSSSNIITVEEPSLNHMAQDTVLPESQSSAILTACSVSNSVNYENLVSDSIGATDEDLSAMTKAVMNEHTDPLQQATNVLFESEEECHDTLIMSSNSSIQYITVPEELNSGPSALTTLVSVATGEHQGETPVNSTASDRKQVVLTCTNSDQIVMVTNAEEGSFILQKDLNQLNIVQLKDEPVTDVVTQPASSDSFGDNAASMEMIASANLLSPNLKIPVDASFVELESTNTQELPGETQGMTATDTVTMTADMLNVQEGDQIFMETTSSSFSPSLEQSNLLLGSYSQTKNENPVQIEAHYHELIMPNGERMQLLIHGSEVHNIDGKQTDNVFEVPTVVQCPENVQVVSGPVLSKLQEISQESNISVHSQADQEPKTSTAPKVNDSEEIEESCISACDDNVTLKESDLSGLGEQYLVILKE